MLALRAFAVHALFCPRANLVLENLALRQQLAILARRRPRPRLSVLDRAFWVGLARLWPGWRDPLAIVQPATVIRWHRLGFHLFWRWRSHPTGRPSTKADLRTLIRRIAQRTPAGARRESTGSCSSSVSPSPSPRLPSTCRGGRSPLRRPGAPSCTTT
jgi:hypothetical protein